MALRRPLVLLTLLGLNACSGHPPRDAAASAREARESVNDARVLIGQSGLASVAIVVSERLLPLRHASAESPARMPTSPKLAKKRKPPKLTREQQGALAEQRRLQAAVQDLGKYLSLMTGAKVPVVSDEHAAPIPIFIGEAAEQHFGPVGVHALGRQGFRYVVERTRIGLYGESDLATSYAVYELLDRLGCRWFMPGALGEDIPRPERVALPLDDQKLAPSTVYRGLWHTDEDFQRRNRLGGLKVAAGHMLERWITAAQRDEHPEWRADVNGVSDPKRLRWSNPELAIAIARAIDARLDKRPAPSVSLSPLDGTRFDEGLDRALDAGDWDPTTNQVSLTDRLLVLANRVAEQVTERRPDVLLGLLAYTSYTRPPVREKVHPNVVPVLAPISYCRTHPISNDDCPGAKDLRDIVQGWAARAERLAFRGYAYNLAEPAAPNPMLRKWSFDLPFLFRNNVQFFQPETLPNFETSLPALWLGIRLSWKHDRDPRLILDELFARFYGHAGSATRRYIDLMDRAWADSPVYAGGSLGYAQRYTPEFMKRARAALDEAKLACENEVERERVALLDKSLEQLELYMKLELDLRSGHIGALGEGLRRWLQGAQQLGERYAPNAAFGKTGWAKASVYGAYGERFQQPIYAEADRIEHEQVRLTPTPLCTARYRALPDARLPILELPIANANDVSTNFCVETWSSLGRHDYFGSMRYQLALPLGEVPSRHGYLWLSKVDGVAQVWVNGVIARPKDATPSAQPTGEAHLKSLTFDMSSGLRANAMNELVIVVQRTRLTEVGAGGLLGPAYAYGDR